MNETQTVPQMVDELGALEAEILPIEVAIKHKQSRMEALRKKIGESSKVLPEQPDTMYGEIFNASVGPRENRTSIKSMYKAFKAVGQKVFLEHCSFSTEKLKVLSPVAELLMEESRKGGRSVRTYRKA